MAYTIIVADPSPSLQKIAQTVFAEPEFRLVLFEDGPTLIDAVEKVRPDAILVSLSLAAPAGEEIGRALRSREGLGSLPIIGLKGTFETPDMDRVRSEDYDGIVQKPFDSERLAALVRELIACKTGPATMPEEPVWPAPVRPEDAAAPPPSSPAVRAGEPDQGFREWVRGEFVAMEREIEKRVRARLLAELQDWMSRGGRAAGPKE